MFIFLCVATTIYLMLWEYKFAEHEEYDCCRSIPAESNL